MLFIFVGLLVFCWFVSVLLFTLMRLLFCFWVFGFVLGLGFVLDLRIYWFC